MRYVILLLVAFSLGCAKMPEKPQVKVCTLLLRTTLEDSACYCVNRESGEGEELPLGRCQVAFTAWDWVKIDAYIKELKKLAEEQCR